MTAKVRVKNPNTAPEVTIESEFGRARIWISELPNDGVLNVHVTILEGDDVDATITDERPKAPAPIPIHAEVRLRIPTKTGERWIRGVIIGWDGKGFTVSHKGSFTTSFDVLPKNVRLAKENDGRC